MQATLSGITTCFKPWQQQNDWVPMLVTMTTVKLL